MATVFRDSQGIIFTDYLEKVRTITGPYYADLLSRFESELIENVPIWRRKQRTSSLIRNCHSKTGRIMLRIAASSSLFSRFGHMQFLLLPNMKKWLGGKRFTTNEQVIDATEAYFAEFDKSYILDGLKKLEYRCTKCIELKGDYIEK